MGKNLCYKRCEGCASWLVTVASETMSYASIIASGADENGNLD